MRSRYRTAAVAAVAAMALSLMGTAAPAQAATGQVVVFSSEFQPLTIYTDPTGCHKLPIAAHSVNNQTDTAIKVYADPLCLIQEVATIRPGYGARVQPGTGSFRA
ncbi:hypothetical protein ABZ470_26145 [Streptosporangium sp. NPDC020072]|uniref:hypothetical protein n=1 Tax=Streptosporangium sp. NPDC020072 TaxID=3154788 RepID=UPI003442AAA2